MIKFSPVNLIEERDFHNAYARAVQFVLRHGVKVTFGDKKEPKIALDSCQTITLAGHALQQIENRELHPKYPFKSVDQYCEEFTREFLVKYKTWPIEKQFSYLYFQRLVEPIDQLAIMREQLAEQLESGISSNRSQGIIWDVKKDTESNSPVCLQRIWARPYEDIIDLHFSWRSRDLHAAWQSNLIAITNMMDREVFKPNNCRIGRIVDSSDSLHIYEGSLGPAKDVNLTVFGRF